MTTVDRVVPSSGDGYDLFRVDEVRSLSDRRIAVLDAGSNEVLLFSPSGQMQGRLGGTGEGPGEFTNTVFMTVLPGDSILVTDLDLSAVVFTSSGAVARTFTLERPAGGYVFPTGMMGTGELFGAQGQEAVTAETTAGMVYRPLQLVVYDLDGSLHYGFEREGIGNEFFLIDQEGTLRATTPPLRTTALAAAGPEGIALATSSSPDVLLVNAAGVVRTIVRVSQEDLLPERQLVDSVRRDWAESPSTEAGRVLRRRALAEMPLPTARPVIGALAFDRSGRLWVADADVDGTPATRWRVYAADSLVGFVELPDAIEVKEIGADHLLAVATDTLGVQSVLRIGLSVLEPE